MLDINRIETEKLKRIYNQLLQLPECQLVSVARSLSEWKWPTILGEPPIEKWEDAPEYRRPWMSEDTPCRSDNIDPYMAVLRVLGVTSDEIYVN